MKAEWPAGGRLGGGGGGDGIDPAPPPGTTCVSGSRVRRGQRLTRRVVTGPQSQRALSRSGASRRAFQSRPADVRLTSMSGCNN